MNITTTSAKKLLSALYELNSLPKTAEGNYVICHENGWYATTPEEAAAELANGDIASVDLVMERIAELSGKTPEMPDLKLQDGTILSFDEESALFEPQAWLYLKDGTSLEITHEEVGFELSEQYFSARHHCSEKDFDDDTYHSTMGVIDQRSGKLADIAPMVDRIVRECGIAEELKPEPEANWEDIGPRAVLSLVAVLYEKKLVQGKTEDEADREADEDVCEMTGLTLSQLGDLYDCAGLDRPKEISNDGWTLCSDALPVTPYGVENGVENPEVLITVLDKADGVREVFKGFYEDGEWWTQWVFGCKRISEEFLSENLEVIAWKPLPNPCRTEV